MQIEIGRKRQNEKITKHNPLGRLGAYIIIDDIEDFPAFKNRWVKIDSKEGLVEKHIEEALNLLSE